MEEIFESSIRSTGDLAGVFEFDGDAGYFYLYSLDAREGNKVLDSIRISIGEPSYTESDVNVQWSADESLVLLNISGQACAVFDCDSGRKFGGGYVVGVPLHLPVAIQARLDA